MIGDDNVLVDKATALCSCPEAELVVLCCQEQRDDAWTKRVRALVQQELEWERVMQAASRHCVLPVLYRSLINAAADVLPEVLRERLQEEFNGNARRNFALTGELLRILELLKAHGIQACPYRGPVLAAAAYGNTTMRQFDDLDLLLHKRDVLRARDLLGAAGFRPELALNSAQQAAYLRAQSELKVADREGEVVVELHWAIAERYFSFALDPEILWQRLVPVSIEGQRVATLSPENLLLILCAHGTKHVWRRLGWVCDISRLLVTNPTLDWSRVFSQARALRSERMLALGLTLAKDLLGSPLPESIMASVRSDTSVTTLVEQVRGWLFQEAEHRPKNLDTALFHLRARERWQDRVRYSMLLAATPTPGDWAAVPMPSWLYPLYYAIRPFRLLVEYALPLHKIRR